MTTRKAVGEMEGTNSEGVGCSQLHDFKVLRTCIFAGGKKAMGRFQGVRAMYHESRCSKAHKTFCALSDSNCGNCWQAERQADAHFKWIVGRRLCRELEVHHEYTCATAGVVMGRMATTICKAAKQNLGGRKKLQQLAFQAIGLIHLPQGSSAQSQKILIKL